MNPRFGAGSPGQSTRVAAASHILFRALGALLAVLLLAGCAGSALDEHTLQKDAESLASLASEGTMLAAQVGQGDGTATFTRVHSAYLVKDVKQLRTTLASARPAPGLAAKRERAVRLAARVEETLAQLHASPRDRELGTRLAARLTRDAEAADELAK